PPVKTFLTVTLPLIAPALASGWMLAFTLSLDDLVVASFTTGPGATTLPIRIYSEVRLGVKPEINAACTILIAVVAVGFVGGSLLTKFHDAGRGGVAGLAARCLSFLVTRGVPAVNECFARARYPRVLLHRRRLLPVRNCLPALELLLPDSAQAALRSAA